MKLGDLFSRSIDGLMHAHLRTLFTTLSIGVASFSLMLAIGINHGGSAYVEKSLNSATDPQSLWVMKKQDDRGTLLYPSAYTDEPALRFHSLAVRLITDDDIASMRGVPGVESAEPVIILDSAYVSRLDQNKYQAVLTAQRSNDAAYRLAGSGHELKDNEVILPEGYRDALGFADPDSAIGASIVVTVVNRSGLNEEKKSYSLKVQTVVRESRDVQTYSPSSLRVTKKTLEEMYKFSVKDTPTEDSYIAASVKVASTKYLEQTKSILANKGYEAQTQADTDKVYTQFADVFQKVMLLFGVMAVIAAIFGVVNTQYMSVLERVQDVGLMKALGMGQHDVAMLFRIEAALIGFFGGTLGVVSAVLVGYILNPILIQISQLDPDTLILRFTVLDAVIVIFGLTFIATIAGMAPAKKASRLDPIDVLRNEKL